MTAAAANRRSRIISVIAATVIALACGTNYVYSAWAPQFAQRLKLSSTQTNLVGTMGNLGMYASGIPIGMLVDSRGPRWGVALGVILLTAGYYPIAKAFDAGPGVYSITTLCLFSFFTGCGSCSAFTASIKAAALNFPDHRGTATAFPLAGFGLSAFFFATLALAVPHDTSHFLLLLASGTVFLPAISFFFLSSSAPPKKYEQLPQHESQRLHRTRSPDERAQLNSPNTGTPQKPNQSTQVTEYHDEVQGDSEHSSLLSSPDPGTPVPQERKSSNEPADAPPPDLDIRGFALLPHPEFWLLFILLALMCGIGLMTINNIGNIAQALWTSFDPDTPASFIAKRQVLHVSILSVMSFTGRLTSGIGSDILVRKYNLSRYWCIVAASVVFISAQVCALTITYPPLLVLVSGITGLAYGMLFGVYPSLVAHAFGVHGLSQNWGTLTIAPVISGNIFNLIYGKIYDSHSVIDGQSGDMECLEGKNCYVGAFWMTLFSSLAALALSLYTIWYEKKVEHERWKGKRRSSGGNPVD